MLSYLVTSKNRRELLRLLWHQRVSGSAQQLADLAGVALSVAQQELADMVEAKLATARQSGRALVYDANLEHPSSETLLKMLYDTHGPADVPSEKDLADDDFVRRALRDHGAPLVLNESDCMHTDYDGPLELLLARGVLLATRDPTVTLVMPVLLFNRRRDWRFPRLRFEAQRLGVVDRLGMFLDLTAKLSCKRRLSRLAKPLKDGRRTKCRRFFSDRRPGKFHARVEEMNTPAVVKKWGYTMNLPMSAFQSQFEKHVESGQ